MRSERTSAHNERTHARTIEIAQRRSGVGPTAARPHHALLRHLCVDSEPAHVASGFLELEDAQQRVARLSGRRWCVRSGQGAEYRRALYRFAGRTLRSGRTLRTRRAGRAHRRLNDRAVNESEAVRVPSFAANVSE